jgi:hypothetical protein
LNIEAIVDNPFWDRGALLNDYSWGANSIKKIFFISFIRIDTKMIRSIRKW